MDRLNFHIAFLLTRHECVIIPGVGALIVSGAKRKQAKYGDVMMPYGHSLMFNSEITDNDGLLANSIAREKNLGYREALECVHTFVDDFRNRLNAHERVLIPWVGRFSLSQSGKILFTPAPNLSCNAEYYGFTSVRLPLLSELSESYSTSRRRIKKDDDVIWIPINRKIALWTASVAASLIAVFFVPSSLNDYTHTIQPRVASFIPFPEKPASVSVIPAFEEVKTEQSAPVKIEEVRLKSAETSAVQPVHGYFIVVSSLATRQIADNEAKRFLSKGFDNALVRSSDNKHRICIASFHDRREAETFLRQFRKNNPEYSKAWLLVDL
ncbi:MAG: SPOR domain-containing protein [Dysgonamonadaceae bacterium]|jgi:hypothetical protein|nr:SPOR domain-containing protein [Dysgonamonadaceae bacterium]